MLRIAFYCPLVGGTVTRRDCAYCRAFQAGGSTAFSSVMECRQENLQGGYECSSCGAFMPPGALLDARGHPRCAHCLMARPAPERIPASGLA